MEVPIFAIVVRSREDRQWESDRNFSKFKLVTVDHVDIIGHKFI